MRKIIQFMFVFAIVVCSNAYAANNIKEMFEEGYGSAEIRLKHYVQAYNEDTKDTSDTGIGGIFLFRTGQLSGISFGLSFTTANNLRANNGDDVYPYGAMLQSGHKGYTKLLEHYIQGDWFNTTIKYGAQLIETPYLHRHDFFFSPKSYSGLSIVNKSIDNLQLEGYYLTKFMSWSDDDFAPITDRLSKSGDENPLLIGGIKYNIPVSFVDAEYQGWVYYIDNYMLNYTTFADIRKGIGDATLTFYPLFTKQDSNGREFAGDFSTQEYGVRLGVEAYGATLTGYYSKTGKDGIVDQWGAGRVILQQIAISGRAEEKAYGVRAAYDFSQIGLNGLDASIFYIFYDTPETGKAASSDMSETDYIVNYNFGKSFGGILDRLSMSVGYADIDVEDDEDYYDLRVEVKYSFAFGRKN